MMESTQVSCRLSSSFFLRERAISPGVGKAHETTPHVCVERCGVGVWNVLFVSANGVTYANDSVSLVGVIDPSIHPTDIVQP